MAFGSVPGTPQAVTAASDDASGTPDVASVTEIVKSPHVGKVWMANSRHFAGSGPTGDAFPHSLAELQESKPISMRGEVEWMRYMPLGASTVKKKPPSFRVQMVCGGVSPPQVVPLIEAPRGMTAGDAHVAPAASVLAGASTASALSATSVASAPPSLSVAAPPASRAIGLASTGGELASW
jgi:hypothetical protein